MRFYRCFVVLLAALAVLREAAALDDRAPSALEEAALNTMPDTDDGGVRHRRAPTSLLSGRGHSWSP